MTEKSFVWPSDGTGDGAPVSVADSGELMEVFLGAAEAGEGVVPRILGELAPSAIAGNTQVRIAPGWGIGVGGHPYRNDANRDITPVTPTTGTTGRRIVLRTDELAQTVRLVEVSSPDGTSAIPSLTADDRPICSFTVTTGGTVGSFLDERQFAPTKRTWRQIAVVDLDSGQAVNALTIALPTGTKAVRLSGSLSSDTNSRAINLRISGLNSTIYGRSYLLGNNNTASASAGTGNNEFRIPVADMAAGDQDAVSFDLLITKRVAGERARITGTVCQHHTGASFSVSALAGVVADISNVLSSVTVFLSSTGGLYGLMTVEAYVDE